MDIYGVYRCKDLEFYMRVVDTKYMVNKVVGTLLAIGIPLCVKALRVGETKEAN